MTGNNKKPILKVGNIWEYYDFMRFGYHFGIKHHPNKIKELTDKGVDFDQVIKCCNQHGIGKEQQDFILGVVCLFAQGYKSAKWFESEYKPNSNNLKEQMEKIVNLDLDQVTGIVILTKREPIKLDMNWVVYDIVEALRELKSDLQPDQVELYGNRSYYKSYINTHLKPFYQFLIDQLFFDTHTEARQFIVDLCECFNLKWESFTESNPPDYLKDRFKEKT